MASLVTRLILNFYQYTADCTEQRPERDNTTTIMTMLECVPKVVLIDKDCLLYSSPLHVTISSISLLPKENSSCVSVGVSTDSWLAGVFPSRSINSGACVADNELASELPLL